MPPTAAPVGLLDLIHGLAGIIYREKYIHTLEREIKNYFGVKHVFLTSSGKTALTMILKALSSLSSGKEVLMPAYTCFSVPSAIVKAGLKVKLCDIEQFSFNFDKGLLKEAINSNTLCVIAHHLFGIPSEMDTIMKLCKEANIPVVEDAAQAMGINYKGNKLGTIGDVGFFSMGRGKNITCGSGGVIITDSAEIAGAINKYYSDLESPGILESLRDIFEALVMNIFINPILFWFPSGLPFLKLGQTTFYKEFPMKKLSGTKAGLMRDWVERLEILNRIRTENANHIIQRLELKYKLNSLIPYLRIPIMLKSEKLRNKIYSASQELGLGMSMMYPTAINEIEEIKNIFIGQSFPSADKVSKTLLAVPTHCYIKDRDRESIFNLFAGLSGDPGEGESASAENLPSKECNYR